MSSSSTGRRGSTFGNWLFALATVLAVIVIAVSVLPYIPSNRWWVRMADFPRLQLMLASLVVLAVLVLAGGRGGWLRWPLVGALGMAATAHAVTLFPYRPGTGDLAHNCPADKRLSVLVANVLMTSKRSKDLLETVDALRPDLVLALETNRYWARELSRLRGRYPHLVEQIGDDYYGLQLYSRLPLTGARVVRLAGAEESAVVADIRMRDGYIVRMLGLHPKPPHPGQSATARDAQLYSAALALRDARRPALVAGDFNATPWETTIARMRRIAGLVDPRRGYGYVATYDSKNPLLRWPLDHVFHTAGFTTVRLVRGREFGSDHFPYFVELCRAPSSGEGAPVLEDGDLAEARAAIAAAVARR